MDKNVGGNDQKLRILLAPFLFLAGFVGTASPDTLATVLGVISLILAVVFGVTGYTQKCPVNHQLGRDTYQSAAK